MCSRTWGAPIFREPACMLCGQTDADPDICGSKQLDFGMCAHAFCMAFSNGLFQQATIVGRTAEVSPEDVQRVVREAERKHCFICGETGAPITCAEAGCEHSFHLPCAREGDCVTQYFGEYSSFCQKHSPKQAAEVAPAQDTNCIICMEPVGDKKSYHTLVCPACKHAWFHRACIQGQAIRAGVNCFQCPLCRDADAFLSDMLVMGIRIPLSGPMWEDGNAYASLGLRHGRCDASECLSPQGRGQAEEEGPWELLLCSSCAAEGTHRRCSYLSNNADAWECKACAGMGTASSVISEVTGPSTASQRGLLPSHGSTAPESGSSSTASLAPSGPVHSSQVPESGSLSSQLGTGHGDDDIYNHPQRCRGSSRAAASSGAADRCTPTSASQRASLSSRASLAVGSRRSRQGERTRTRSRSPIQSQAPDSHSHPQRCSRRSRAPAPRAEGGSQLNTRRGALGSSRDSTAAHQRSQSRQREQARARSRSPVGRGPAESRGQLQRHHRSQSRR
ncbi:PHD finger protein 7-like isoform X3 [Gallus gallus]|nr:PHD finger protein 7-like isoform X3 [Gallus gallus]